MTLRAGLVSVGRAVARRRASALALGALATALALFGAAAVLARAGAFSAVRWLPLAVWVAVLGLMAWCAWRLARLAGGSETERLRGAARLVERELAMRRGAMVGVVDLMAVTPAGMSAELAARAEGQLAARLPASARAWAPGQIGELGRLVRARTAGVALAAVFTVAGFWFAGDAAAALLTPGRALKAAARPRVTLVVSARSIRKGGAVTARVSALPLSRPVLFVRSTGEAWRPVPLAADEGGAAAYRVADITAPLYLYATLDGAASDTVRVAVVAPPFVADFAVTARYPAYLDRPDEPVLLDAGVQALPAGTVLEVTGAASAPLARAALVRYAPDDSAARAPTADTATLGVSGASFRGALTVRRDAVWKLALRDRLGAPVPEPLPELAVRAVPDSAPVVRVPVPGADTAAPLDLKPVVVIDARDDHGLGRVALVSWRVSQLGVVGDSVVDTLAGVNGADHLVQSQTLDLSARGLLPGDTVRYYVRATDLAPTPNLGRSPVYAFRLRSLEELRDAVSRGADSLAGAVSALADDQSGLTRRTEDLAAQRSRAGDRTSADPNAPAGDTRPSPNGTLPFEQTEEARRLSDEQQQLVARADSLSAALERVARAADDAGLNDPAWRQQLQHLEELMRQAMTPEMQQRLQELQQALQRLDPQAVQRALQNLADQQRLAREQLQRSAELFERAALEGSMQTLADNADALRQAQDQWNREAATRDSAASTTDEHQLSARADSLQRRLSQLAQRLAEHGDTASQAVASQSADSTAQASSDMDSAASAMAGGERPRAGRQGQHAADALRNVPQQLNRQRQQLASLWRQEVLHDMDDASSETIALAAEEQRLAHDLRQGDGSGDARGRQDALEEGINQVARRLQDAAGRNAMVNPRLGSSLAQARDATSQSRESLEGQSPNPDEAADQADAAARGLTQAAYQMMRNRGEVAGTESGSGLAEAMERMAQLAGQQGALTSELGGMMPMLGSGDAALMMRLRALAQRQRDLANDLERLGESALPGHPEQMAQEARTLADRLDQGRIDRSTLERQQRLFRHMLDAGRTLQSQDQPSDPERRSIPAGSQTPRAAPGTAANGALRYPPPPWSALKELSAPDRALVLEYFRRLNAQP